jgi:hypothetical protein
MYLRGTCTHVLCFGGSNNVLQGYVDSDMEGDQDSRRSTTMYVFNNKLDFETAKGCCTFNNGSKVCYCYIG